MIATENTPEATVTDANRETWLVKAVDALRPMFAELDLTDKDGQVIDTALPPVRISVGFPGGRSAAKVIGQCWSPAAATDEVAQLFVSPVLDDAVRVMDVLAHELIHAIDRCESGHKGKFAKIAKAFGLTGKMTATVVEEGSELKARLNAIINEIGPYPHAALSLGGATSGPKKQATRMIKLECPVDGYTVRTTQKWIELGTPTCPCGEHLDVAA